MPSNIHRNPPLPGRKPLRPSGPLVDEELKNFIQKNEASIPYFYKDTKGKVTIGFGQMIPDAATAEKLPLYVYASDKEKIREASPAEKREAFARVRSYNLGSNAEAEAYDPLRNPHRLLNLKMDSVAMEMNVEQRLRDGIQHLKTVFPDFETYPRPAQIVLFDMEYNLGPTKFRHSRKDPQTGQEKGWPKLFDAVMNRDWQKAADQSHRRDVDDERNKKTNNLFLEGKRWDKR